MAVVGEVTNNLLGLQQLAAGRQSMQAQAKQTEDNRIAAENLRKYQSSLQSGAPDYEAFNEAIIRSPEMAQNVLAGIGITERRQGLDAADFAVKAASVIDNKPQFMQLIKNRVDYLTSQGRDPKDTMDLGVAYLEGDVEGAKNSLKAVSSALANQGYLDKSIYGSLYGSAQEGLTPYQQARLSLEQQRLAQGQTGTSNQKDWETYQRLLNEDPDAAESFGRAAGFVGKEGQQLSAYAEKQLDAASTEAAQASADSSRYLTLAEQIRRSNMSGGLQSTWGEFIKEQTGNQDEITALRKQVLQIVNSEAIKSLPPGPATDRDIELVRSPFPTEKSSPEYVANWLEAISRLNNKRSEFSEFKANFISQNGSLRDKQGNSLVKAWKETQKQSSQGGSGEGAMTTGINPEAQSNTVNWSDL